MKPTATATDLTQLTPPLQAKGGRSIKYFEKLKQAQFLFLVVPPQEERHRPIWLFQCLSYSGWCHPYFPAVQWIGLQNSVLIWPEVSITHGSECFGLMRIGGWFKLFPKRKESLFFCWKYQDFSLTKSPQDTRKWVFRNVTNIQMDIMTTKWNQPLGRFSESTCQIWKLVEVNIEIIQASCRPCNSTNRQNSLVQQKCCNFCSEDAILT